MTSPKLVDYSCLVKFTAEALTYVTKQPQNDYY